jgi:MscS family membrane protein
MTYLTLIASRLTEQASRILPVNSPLLQKGALGLMQWQWLGLLSLIVLGYLAQRALSKLTQRIAQELSGAQITLDETQLKSFTRPLSIALSWALVWSLYLALEIPTPPLLNTALRVISGAVISIAGGFASWRVVDVISEYLEAKAKLTESRFDDMLVPLVRRVLKLLVLILGFGFFLSTVTDSVYKVVAGLSIGSAVLMFAFKDSLENVFGTFTVLMDKPFQLGDWITVDDVDGTVERVGFRSTRVRTFYNSIITVPNRHFISAKVDNWGSRKYRRLKTTLGLTYDTPPEKIEAFCEGVRELIRQHPYTRKDYYHVYFNEFGASSLDVMLYCFLETPDWSMELRERHRLFADILRLAEGLGVSFAFPSTSVYMVSPEELEHSDRPASDPEGTNRGRALAQQIAEESLKPFGDNKPGKVKFVHQGSPLAAPGGEGDGG